MKLGENDARARLASARVATLATITEDARPHLVPVVFAIDGDLIHTAVDHKPKSTSSLRRLRNIRTNPRVALLAQLYDEDWDALWWVRVDGSATVVTDPAEMRHPIDLLVARYEQYRTHRPGGPVITISAGGWSGWASTTAMPGPPTTPGRPGTGT